MTPEQVAERLAAFKVGQNPYLTANETVTLAPEVLAIAREYAAQVLREADDSQEMAWGLIANAFGGDWSLASDEWREAAVRWRDEYHARIRARADQEVKA